MEITNIEQVSQLPITEAIIPIEHTLVDGLYTRIAYAKANTLIIGAKHIKGGTAFLLSGKIRQIDGDNKYEISAPAVVNTQSGTQRTALVLEDCAYATTHATDAKSVEEAEALLFDGVSQLTRIRNSFKEVLLLTNKTEEDVLLEMDKESISDEVSDIYEIKVSPIHGLGCFAKVDININTTIAFAVVDNVRMPTARYINHSDISNSKFIDYKDGLAVLATKLIPKGHEILLNYKDRLCHQQ